jgi:hypothetical protein
MAHTTHRLRLQRTKHGVALKCEYCPATYATAEYGKMVITSSHDSRIHTNGPTPDELRLIADFLDGKLTVDQLLERCVIVARV